MHCAHCGRTLLRDPAATVTTRDGALHWGPKCAARAGLTNPAKRQILTMIPAMNRRAKTTQRAADHTGQADWIDNLNTPQPDQGWIEPRATP